MSLERGKFGIEWTTRPEARERSGLGWVFVVVALVALASFAWTLVKRVRSGGEGEEPPPSVAAPVEASAPSNGPPPSVVAAPPPKPVVAGDGLVRRPVRLRNLLMRLDEAERARDVEMAVSTIETIRALPGSPAADLDDRLARRLGELNVRRLFEQRSAQWVKEVKVKRGDSASRLAAENGSTLASLERLNGGRVDRIIVGATLYVMDHPRFNLVVHRRARTADLSLNGKFFRRYDLADEVKAKAGPYELPERKRAFWANIGAQFAPDDRAELETLLPARTPVLISEM